MKAEHKGLRSILKMSSSFPAGMHHPPVVRAAALANVAGIRTFNLPPESRQQVKMYNLINCWSEAKLT